MALTLQALQLIKPYLKGRILQLGYNDILATPEEVEELFRVSVKERTDFGKWHGIPYPLVETQAFLEALGCHSTCIDIVKARGCEVVCDLNVDVLEMIGHHHYDLVIDGGTLEHVFNIGQALMNVAQTVKVGGVIFHGNPVNWINHGFYSISPTLLHDFYTQNGWEELHTKLVDRYGKVKDIIPTRRFVADTEISNLYMARRKNYDGLKYPMQTKYLNNPGLK